MSRSVAVLLCCFSVLAVTAAPVPPYRPSKVWETGWDKPVALNGDCRFDRDGSRLTIAAPNGGKARLMRDAKGDFAVRVKVDSRGAGLVLVDAEAGRVVTLLRGIDSRVEMGTSRGGGQTHTYVFVGTPHLLLERERGRLRVGMSTDGKRWEKLEVSDPGDLNRKFKVGVTAGPARPLKVTFDEFKLTPLGGDR